MQNSDEIKTSTLARDLCQIFSVFFALLIRIILGVFSVLTVMVVVDKRNDQRFWALTSILSLLILESVYTIVKRRGQERKWVCLCFVCYLLATIPSVWLLELQRLGLFESRYSNTNTTGVSSNLPGGLKTNFQLDSDEIIFIMENCLVFLLILCRWLLPRGDITRDQLSQLLFVFIGMASDVMELFQLFDADKVKNDRTLSYIILTVWTVSLFQFTLVLTMSANPKKARVVLDDDGEVNEDGYENPSPLTHTREDQGRKGGGDKQLQTKQQNRKTFRDYVLQSEIWSLFVSILMQDGPFLAVRLYVVIELGVIDSSTVFFVLKNTIVILLLAYRLIVVALLMAENNEDNEPIDTVHKDTSIGIAHTNGTPGAKSPLKKRFGTYNVNPPINGSTPSIPASTASNKSRARLNKVKPLDKA